MNKRLCAFVPQCLCASSKGFAIISVFLVTLIVLALGTAFLLMLSSELEISDNEKRAIEALYLAEAGVQEAIAALNNYSVETEWDSGGWTTPAGGPYTRTVTSFQSASGDTIGDFTISVTNPTGSSPQIDAVGYVPSQSSAEGERQVRALTENPTTALLAHGVFGKNSVTINGSVTTDSYDSNDGAYGPSNQGSNGDVGSNGTSSGAVTLIGSAVIDGDVSTGAGGTIQKTGSIEITGDETDDNDVSLPSATVPSALSSLTSNGDLTVSSDQEIGPGDMRYDLIKVTGSNTLTITGPARLYLSGSGGKSLWTIGTSAINISGSVEIYCDADIDVGGTGLVNSSQDPPSLILYGTSTCDDIDFSGTADLYGAIYAPDADIDVSGSVTMYGSMVGETVGINGSAVIHYDEALASEGPSTTDPSIYNLSLWREI